MSTKNSLLVFRDKINNIDKKIVQLLSERRKLVLKIAESKIKNNQAIRDIDREKKILEKLIILGKKNNLQPKYITQLFQLIIKESVLTQQKLLKKFNENYILKIPIFSFLGSKGSYSYIATSEYANQNFKKYITKSHPTFEEVILSVENNKSDYAVLPIENTSSGFINEVVNLLKESNLSIIGEISIFINHCLLAIKKIELNRIKTIYSHSQPFQQCSNFIEKFPNWEIKYTNSTADAMKQIKKYNNITDAALGSEIGSKIYGLSILSKNLSNKQKNITRFILLHKNPVNVSSEIQSKTTLIFSIKELKNLSEIFLILQQRKITIKKLIFKKQDRNSLKEIFYLDIEANLSSKSIQDSLKKIQQKTEFLKILGCYPNETLF